MLAVLDAGLFVFHTVLIAFNIVGWAWRRTRVAHLVVLAMTTFSWFVMGAFYGWGYCLCTDWHFRVRRSRGVPVPESSFVQLLGKTLGVHLNRGTADALAVGVFAAIVVATAITWAIAWRRRAPERRV